MTDMQSSGDVESSPVAKRQRLDDAAPLASSEAGVETRMTESRAGITSYVDPTIPGFQGIIKQRFTDFMVNEIDLQGKVCRLTSLDPPAGKYLQQLRPQDAPVRSAEEQAADAEKAAKDQAKAAVQGGMWPEEADAKLATFFTSESIAGLREMWAQGRQSENMGTGANATLVSAASITTRPLEDKEQRTQVHKLVRELFAGKLATDSCMVRPRGARAGDDEEDALANGGGAAATRIAVRWANRSDRRAGDDLSEEATNSPPYIHFLLHKTNRDHQEAMGMLAESLRLGGGGGGRGRGRGRGGFGRGGGRPPTKDLDVAGTKDKRAVTVQRVSLKRNRKTLDDVYRLVNGINADLAAAGAEGKGKGRGRTVADVVSKRADRGLRIGHLEYATHPLKLGMLKGNEFTITLRNVCPSTGGEADEAFASTVRRSMDALRDRGFINYFGLQRFGTGAIPTHHIGILILKNDFKQAIELLMMPRGASGPEADDGDGADLLRAKECYQKGEWEQAYQAVPKNCVAEKHILDKMRSARWSQGDWTGAFGNVPRTLRLMYVHAYQSYVWNRLVSERIARFGSTNAVEGDLVFTDKIDDWETTVGDDDGEEDDDDLRNARSEVATWQRPTKQLSSTDVGSSSIYDVVLPLAGASIDLPVGWMSELYHTILAADGLTHAQLSASKIPEYQLKGSYRRIMVRPRSFEFNMTHYTDPDIALTLTDEERCLNLALTQPETDQAAQKFLALTLKFQLPTSSYATMLMREALKHDTASFKHRQLTQASQDQHFKGSATH